MEDLKALIETEAEKATGRKLAIADGAKPEISLTPSLVLEDVTFADALGLARNR